MKSNKSSCTKVKEKALMVDSFGKPFSFMLPNGQKMYRSLVGAVLTVIIIVSILLYALYKWQLLIDKDEAQISLTIEESYYRSNESSFTRAGGFHLAVGILSTFKHDKLFEDQTYGDLRVIQKHTNERENLF